MLIGFPLAWEFLNIQQEGPARCTVKKTMVAHLKRIDAKNDHLWQFK